MNDLLPAHRIVTRHWMSAALNCEKRISVLLPARRCGAGGTSPVLILLHGYGGSRHTWIGRTRLIEYLQGKQLLVVLLDSGRRWFINDHAGFRYEDYLIGEVVPFVRDTFDVAARRCGWAIGGFSMGGAAALIQALRHPHLFSVVVSHAGAFEGPLRRGDPYSAERAQPDFVIPTTEVHERVWGPYGSTTRRFYDPYALIQPRRADASLGVYADVGRHDHARIVAMNRNAVAALRQAGIEVEYTEREGAHDLEFLNRGLPFSLDFAARKLSVS